jgi:hypothetical protein
MKRRAVIFVVMAFASLLAVVYLWGPSSVPAGQGPLVVLSNADLREFAATFDGDTEALRVILLLSPT